MKYPKDILDKLNAITDKRPATVIQHILKHSFVTYTVKSSEGKSIGAYKFGDPVFADNKLSKVAVGPHSQKP